MSMINKEIGAFSAQAYINNQFKTVTKLRSILLGEYLEAVGYTEL